jgi:PTS system nitrogen regulatory IIA component
MDRVTQCLCPQVIELDLDVPSKWEALQAVSAMIERSHRLSAPPVFRALWRREQAGSTGVGNGFAIPHARITGISEPVTVYVRTKAPVNFSAPDGKRVSELFVILVPSDGANAKHLQLLALVAEAFSDSDFRAHLAAASEPQDVRSAFAQWIDEKQLGATEGSPS